MSIDDTPAPFSGHKLLEYQDLVIDRAPAAREFRKLPEMLSGGLREWAVKEAKRAEQLFLAELFMTAVGHPSDRPDNRMALRHLKSESLTAYSDSKAGLLTGGFAITPEELLATLERRAIEYLEQNLAGAAENLKPYKDKLAREKAAGARAR